MLVVTTVNNECIQLAQDDESKAFFFKMVGDYYRYAAESASASGMDEVKNGAV